MSYYKKLMDYKGINEHRNCLNCEKELEIKGGKLRLNPNRKFCNDVCKAIFNFKKDYQKNKDNKDYKKKRHKQFNKWYKNNKERQNKLVLENYYKNKKEYIEREYVNYNKKRIWEILGKKCKKCGKTAKEIHHLTYEPPKRERYPTRAEKEEYLSEYCKLLEPLCKKCHAEKRKK